MKIVQFFFLAASLAASSVFALEKGEMQMPNVEGERYQAQVPDTLDLSERAALAINGLTGTLDEEHNYEQYFLVRYTADPPYMMHMCIGDLGCTPKYAESLPMMRVMSGSEQNLETERRFMEALVELLDPEDGLFYTPAVDLEKTPWRNRGDYEISTEDMAAVFGNARMMLAMQAWYQRDGAPAWEEWMRKMTRGFDKIAIHNEDYAFYPEGKVGMEFAYLRDSGYKYDEEPKSESEGAEGTVLGYQGGQIRALCRWYEMSGDEKALELAGKLVRFCTKDKFWGNEKGQDPWIDGADHAYFSGHFHGHHIALRGILEYAQIVNDSTLKEFVRDGYEHARCWGIGRIGIFGCGVWGAYNEGCSTADMVALAIKLSEYGVGDYWEDVDQYVRNNLVEQQLTDAELLREVSKASAENPEGYLEFPQEPMGTPWNLGMWGYFLDITSPQPLVTENAIERSLGLYAGFSLPTTLPNTLVCGCCSGNCTQALFYAWDSIVRCEDGNAKVNLLLNRASPWLDVDSYLPYEGKVVIHNKKAETLSVRIPRWVSKNKVNWDINGKDASARWVMNYLVFDDALKAGDKVTITFPMVEETAKYTYQFDKEYTCHFKGNTLIDISPRDKNPMGYPIYLRDHYHKNTAPMKTVERYVSPVRIEW